MIRLCSSSSTRARLLHDAGIAFTQSPADFDEESLHITEPKTFVYEATRGKLAAALKAYALTPPLLVADTVITAQNRLLRKAKDKADARTILQTISGHQCAIMTCTIFYAPHLQLIDLSATWYQFESFEPNALEQYLDTGDWEGKAGACMVEGFCKPYIKSVHGYESTAMGLTIEAFLPYLKGFHA